MSIKAIVLFSAAVALLIISPGPSVAVVVGRTLGSGFRSGMTTVLGVYIGGATYLTLSFTGLTALALSAGPIFSIIKYIGAFYLIWLGWNTFRKAGAPKPVQSVTSKNAWRDLSAGLMVTLVNPKPVVFYSALLPMFLDMSKSTLGDLGILLTILAVCTLSIQGVYAYLSNKTRQLASSGKVAKRLEQTSGGTMIAAGVLVASR